MIGSAIVARALRLLKVLASGETADASETEDGVTALNHMLHAWALEGIDLGHSDIASTDTLNVPDEYLECVVYNLAVRLANEYPVDPNTLQILVNIASNRFDRLHASYVDIPEVIHDQTLLDSDAQRAYGYNILND